jgi:hypothetical protein
VKLALSFALVAISSTAAFAQSSADRRPTPSVDTEFIKQFGALPAPGNVRDVLACAAANELVWTEAAKKDPYAREGVEAKRKAGWYSAVALHVFAVESGAVLDAIAAAKAPGARSASLETATRCRPAPANWRE